MTYRDTQAAIIAALADHARPGNSSWQKQYRCGYWDSPVISLIRSSLVGMEETAGQAAMVLRNMETLCDLHLSLLIVRYETQFPSPRHEASLQYASNASIESVTGLSNFRLRQAIIRSSLTPGKRKKKPKFEELADRYNVHAKTVSRHYAAISEWTHREFDKAMAEMTDKLEARGLIESTQPVDQIDAGMVEKLRRTMKNMLGIEDVRKMEQNTD